MKSAAQSRVLPPLAASGVRNAYIDGLRGWSIFGVVCIHFAGSFVSSANAWTPSFFLGLVLNQVFNFAVPLFLFLSGLLAGTASSETPSSLGAYYLSRFRRIALPYLAASIASFFLLNHYREWLALPTFDARAVWMASRLFFYGVEPTLYFIPLVITLYLFQPALKALPHWLGSLAIKINPRGIRTETIAVALVLLFLGVHLALGMMCYRNTLNYYDWARPNALFWLFYFFAGLHFRSITEFVSRRGLVLTVWVGFVAALFAMHWNFIHLTDSQVVGLNFEFSKIDYAYVRPEMLIYDFAVVAALAAGLALGWNWRAGVAAYLGRFSLEIYLWHILVLYFGAWQFPEALAACREMPELIVFICAGTCGLIAFAADRTPRLFAAIRQYRLLLVKID